MRHYFRLNTRLDVLLAVLVITFLVFSMPELFPSNDPSSFNLINNSRCFPVVGCNAGFFGYDAITHMAGGILWATLFVWLMLRYKRMHILHTTFGKSFFVIISTITLIHVGWEFYEFGLDKIDTLLLGRPLHFDEIAQPSNTDTMGDLIFGLLGAMCGVFLMRLVEPTFFKRQQENERSL